VLGLDTDIFMCTIELLYHRLGIRVTGELSLRLRLGHGDDGLSQISHLTSLYRLTPSW